MMPQTHLAPLTASPHSPYTTATAWIRPSLPPPRPSLSSTALSGGIVGRATDLARSWFLRCISPYLAALNHSVRDLKEIRRQRGVHGLLLCHVAIPSSKKPKQRGRMRRRCSPIFLHVLHPLAESRLQRWLCGGGGSALRVETTAQCPRAHRSKGRRWRLIVVSE